MVRRKGMVGSVQVLECPSCGEQETLTGRTTASGRIEVECPACGHVWERGAARCRSCGGGEVVQRPQTITRTPRGNQLAIIGGRQVPLCPVCDRDAVEDSLRLNQPVPTTYLSRYLLGTPLAQPGPAPQPKPQPDPEPMRPAPTASSPPPPRQEAPVMAAVSQAQPEAKAPLCDPTVRQAVQAFLEDAPDDADRLVMLLLGQQLGVSQRLSTLRESQLSARLADWFATTTARQGQDQRAAGLSTLTAVSRYWRQQGWLSWDLTGHLPGASAQSAAPIPDIGSTDTSRPRPDLSKPDPSKPTKENH